MTSIRINNVSLSIQSNTQSRRLVNPEVYMPDILNLPEEEFYARQGIRSYIRTLVTPDLKIVVESFSKQVHFETPTAIKTGHNYIKPGEYEDGIVVFRDGEKQNALIRIEEITQTDTPGTSKRAFRSAKEQAHFSTPKLTISSSGVFIDYQGQQERLTEGEAVIVRFCHDKYQDEQIDQFSFRNVIAELGDIGDVNPCKSHKPSQIFRKDKTRIKRKSGFAIFPRLFEKIPDETDRYKWLLKY
ncbi:hypothetical protein BVX97_00500 [bacterium E08(2017)]|nr:hypothetical protein BVX97_00500 [bacterium E08(2017)]